MTGFTGFKCVRGDQAKILSGCCKVFGQVSEGKEGVGHFKVGNQIQRINTEKFLPMQDTTGCPFDNQCNLEALESSFPSKNILNGPVQKGKLRF